MDLSEYTAHIKRTMIQNMTMRINTMPLPVLLDRHLDTIRMHNPAISMTDFERVIKEATTLDEADERLGLPESDVGYDPDDKDEVEENITDAFYDVISAVLDKPGGSVLLSFVYADTEDFDPNEMRGGTMIFGERALIDAIRDDVDVLIDKHTDNGIVDTIFMDKEND